MEAGVVVAVYLDVMVTLVLGAVSLVVGVGESVP